MKTILFLCLAGVCAYGGYAAFQGDDPMAHLLSDPPAMAGGGIKDVTGQADQAYPVPGRITVWVFYERRNSACYRMSNHLRDLSQARPDVVIMKVCLDPLEPVAHQSWSGLYYIEDVPHVILFGTDGKVLASDAGSDHAARLLLFEWMKEEATRSH